MKRDLLQLQLSGSVLYSWLNYEYYFTVQRG